jgi:hypothetical protein
MEAGAQGGGCCGVTEWAWASECVASRTTVVWRCDDDLNASWPLPEQTVRLMLTATAYT